MPATKDQIADAFSRHVERFGFGKASVEDVAAELGISKRTVYQHFSSKKDLYAYVVDRIAVSEEQRLRAALADGSDPRARMRAFLGMVVAGMRAHIEATTRADWMQEFEVAFDAMARAYGAIGVELVEEGAATGAFAMTDAALTNASIGAIVLAYSRMVRDAPGYDRDREVVESIVRMLGEVDTTDGAGPGARRTKKG